MNILIIEDNTDIGALTACFLRKNGYNCHHCLNGEDGLKYITENSVEIVLLDIMLPGIDGFEVCRQIRRICNAPVLMLSAKADKDSQLNGLILGADDYIEKPFDIDILTAKIDSLCRRYYNQESVIETEGLTIDRTSHTAAVNGNSLDLNVKEFDLLVYLVENRGKALRKEQIFDAVWGVDSFSEQSTLTVHINRLREKIEINPKSPKRIVTVWGVGYKFT